MIFDKTKRYNICLIFLVVFFVYDMKEGWYEMKIVDLTLPIYSGMKTYPGDPEVSVDLVHTYDKDSWQLRRLTLGTHTGTHVDAFSHMDPEGKTLDQIPVERFFGKAYVVEINQPFPKNTGLFFKETLDIDLLEKILAAEPPFVGGEISEEMERALLTKGIITYTNLTHLDLLPSDKPFMFYGFPLKIKDGDGSPVRAVAIIE